MRRMRNGPWTPTVCFALFLVVVVLGLHVAESGVNALRGSYDPLLFDARFDRYGDFEISLLGMSFEVKAGITLCALKTSPDQIALARGDAELVIPLRFPIPGSAGAISAVKKLVLQATEAGFSASRAIYRWWESRQ